MYVGSQRWGKDSSIPSAGMMYCSVQDSLQNSLRRNIFLSEFCHEICIPQYLARAWNFLTMMLIIPSPITRLLAKRTHSRFSARNVLLAFVRN